MATKKIESLQDIKAATVANTEAKAPRKSVKDKKGRSYATGKEKTLLPEYGLCLVKVTSPSMTNLWMNILPVRF